MNCGTGKSGTEKGINLKQPGIAGNPIRFGDTPVPQTHLPGLSASEGVVASAQFGELRFSIIHYCSVLDKVQMLSYLRSSIGA